MKLSIEQNKGFYVGRFEAGRDGETIVVDQTQQFGII